MLRRTVLDALAKILSGEADSATNAPYLVALFARTVDTNKLTELVLALASTDGTDKLASLAADLITTAAHTESSTRPLANASVINTGREIPAASVIPPAAIAQTTDKSTHRLATLATALRTDISTVISANFAL